MILYDRFEVPDNWDWSTGRPAPAIDLLEKSEVQAFRASLHAQSKEQWHQQADRVLTEFQSHDSSLAQTAETFDAHGFAWLITPKNGAAGPLVEKLRQGGLLADPKAAPSAQPCSQCKASCEPGSTLCVACTQKAVRDGELPRGKAAARPALRAFHVAVAIVILIALMLAGMFWISNKPPVVLIADFTVNHDSTHPGETVEVRWSTENASSVTLKSEDVQGSQLSPTSLDELTPRSLAPNGKLELTPDVTTTYTLEATGHGKTVTRQITVNVHPSKLSLNSKSELLPLLPSRKPSEPAMPPPGQPTPGPPAPEPAPTASFYVNGLPFSATIQEGQSAQLGWSTTGASSVVIDPDIGSVPASGSRQVAPTAPTNYTLTAIGSENRRIQRTSVLNVNPSPPTLTVTANGSTEPLKIRKGERVHLCWAGARVDRLDLMWSGQVYNQPSSAPPCFDIVPTEDTTLSLRALHGVLSVTASVQVTVIQPPPPVYPPPAQRPSQLSVPEPPAPVNGGMTGAWIGVVRNSVTRQSAKFVVNVIDRNGSLSGCVMVMSPLYGSGTIYGKRVGSRFSMTIRGRVFTTSAQGEVDGKEMSGNYQVSVGSQAQRGDFSLSRYDDGVPAIPAACPTD